MKWYQNKRYYALYLSIIVFVISILIYKILSFDGIYSFRYEGLLDILPKLIILAVLFIGGFLAYRPIKEENYIGSKSNMAAGIAIVVIGIAYIISLIIGYLYTFGLLQNLSQIFYDNISFFILPGISIITFLILFLIYMTPEHETRMKYLMLLLLSFAISLVVGPFVSYLFNMIDFDISQKAINIVDDSLKLLIRALQISILLTIGKLYDGYKKKMIISWVIYLIIYTIIQAIWFIVIGLNPTSIDSWISLIYVLNIVNIIPMALIFISYYKSLKNRVI